TVMPLMYFWSLSALDLPSGSGWSELESATFLAACSAGGFFSVFSDGVEAVAAAGAPRTVRTSAVGTTNIASSTTAVTAAHEGRRKNVRLGLRIVSMRSSTFFSRPVTASDGARWLASYSATRVSTMA